ncbi:MAG: lipid-A-disaccharide synthase [Alphaproteobacteria bacterium]|nr:lipid-A-disaccharide synthase [Alphaproteobacteria bacterium]
MDNLKVYLITGEPSGDLLGSRLMRALKKQTNNNIHFMGVGGETMQAEGLNSLFDIKDLAVMGIFEVLPSIPKILRHMNNIIADIQKQKPDIIITIDSYSFCARIHKRLKKADCSIPHVHYVAPQVWAWKKGRAKHVAKFIDHMFCLLPSEPAYFTPHGMATTFVGHPVIEGGAATGNGQAFRKNYLVSQKTTLVCMLPGSRRNEVDYLLPVFKQAIEQLSQKYPDMCVVIPTVKTVSDKIKQDLKGWRIPFMVIEGERERYDAFAAADVAVAASGTVSLELAMADVPHLIAYKVNKVTGWMAKCLLKIKYVNLINILSGREIIPELLQDDCTPEKICAEMERLLVQDTQDVKRHMNVLGFGGELTPSEVMAGHVIKLAKQRKTV